MSHLSRTLTILGFAAASLAAVPGCSNSQEAGAPPAAAQLKKQQSENSFRFIVLSDRTGGHIPGEFEKAITEIAALKPDFVINIGDLVEGYTDSEKELVGQWEEVDGMIAKLGVPFFYVPGNHDLVDDGQSKAPGLTRKIFLQRHGVNGKTYYSFDFRGSHFVALDSIQMDKDKRFAEEQFAWLQGDLQKAKDAQHVYVFYHHPMWENKQFWPRLAGMLPAQKATIFNGHWHNFTYKQADGVRTYALSATAAGIGDGPDALGNFRMFAHVSVEGGKDSVSFIPVGQVRPAGYAPAVMAAREAIKGSPAPVINAEGGTVSIGVTNTGTEPLVIDYRWSGGDWTVAPASKTLSVAPQSSGQAEFVMTPSGSSAGNPTLVESFHVGGYGFDRKQTVPVSRKGTLGRIATVQLDGKLDEWNDIPAVEMAGPEYLFAGNSAWRGAQDSACRFRMAVSGDRLAMAIEVTDDQLALDKKDPWEMDSVELCWDVRPSDKKVNDLTAGAGQFALVPTLSDGPVKQIVWTPARKSQPAPQGLQTYCRRTEKGYTIELTVPQQDLGLAGGTLRSAGTINLAVVLNDRDIEGKDAVQKRLSITGTGDFWQSTASYARFTAK